MNFITPHHIFTLHAGAGTGLALAAEIGFGESGLRGMRGSGGGEGLVPETGTETGTGGFHAVGRGEGVELLVRVCVCVYVCVAVLTIILFSLLAV